MTTIAEIRQKYPQYQDMSDQQLSDALHQKHYSDMPREEFDAKIGLKPAYGADSHIPALSAATESSQAGMMFGIDDELGAGMIAPFHAAADFARGKGFNLKDNYNRLQAELDARKGARREAHPVASIAGEVAGGLTTGGSLAAKGVTMAGRALPVVGKTGAAMLEGGAYGAAYGAGEADPGERLEGAMQGAAVGAATGGVVDKVGRGLAARAAKKALPPAQTSDEIANASRGFFKQVDDAGITVKSTGVNKALANVQLKLGKLAFDPDLHPETAAILKKFTNMKNQAVKFSDLENIRILAGDAAREAAKSRDKNAAREIVKQIDQLIETPANFQASDSRRLKEGLSAVKEARRLWAVKLQTEIVEDLIENAKNQATGFENGLVIGFRKLANNKKLMAKFSPDQQQLIKDTVRRASLRGTLRAIGMLSPNSTFGGIVLGGTAVGPGIAPAAAVAGTGFAARKAAEALTRGKAETIRRAVSSSTPYKVGPNKAIPFIGGTAVANTETARRLVGPQ